MPKAVDFYVLEKKIGSGQFGYVFKGYSKVDGTEVAIKTINRSKIKGTHPDKHRQIHIAARQLNKSVKMLQK